MIRSEQDEITHAQTQKTKAAGMTVAVVTPDEIEELKRLYQALPAASATAANALLTDGMDSHAFLEADQQVGAINARIRVILGVGGQHWTS